MGVGESGMITSWSINFIDEASCCVTFTSDRTPPIDFRIYYQGTLFASLTSAGTTASLNMPAIYGEHPHIEVLDSSAASPGVAFPGRWTLNWFQSSGAVSYRIEEYVSGVWTLRETVAEQGYGAYNWLTRWLEDCTQHQFRIIPVDAAGNQGSATSFTATMVRHPDLPNVTISVLGGLNFSLTSA